MVFLRRREATTFQQINQSEVSPNQRSIFRLAPAAVVVLFSNTDDRFIVFLLRLQLNLHYQNKMQKISTINHISRKKSCSENERQDETWLMLRSHKTKEVTDGWWTEQHHKHTEQTRGRSRPIPFFLAAVSVCDIQAFTENWFAKRGQTERVTSGESGGRAAQTQHVYHGSSEKNPDESLVAHRCCSTPAAEPGPKIWPSSQPYGDQTASERHLVGKQSAVDRD